MIELTKEYIDHLKDIITEKDDAKIKEILDELYPADIAELYQELDLQEAIYLYLLMDGEKAADVLMELDEEDRHVMVMCGMSAAFAALFGTPMAAAVFAMEVVSVGVMYYTALVPCIIASLIASGFAASMGINPEAFHVTSIPALTIESGIKMGIVALCCCLLYTSDAADD